ncbi:hypothetical protein MVEN_00564700 [Mycena venus]|uniref:Uncharacterized protein n=1 Tax=Mycena venus TaxID=2733690 RepID=A0A8H7D808_9AGAR|nr:hypothetical protein MVEN_00564700 [Mycena venus]
MSTGRTTQSKTQQAPRAASYSSVLFANLPTLKVIEPPKGSFSTRNDQWCITYCSQNVSGRIHNKPPWCRSVCIRKVFSHEVRNILQFQSHRDIGPDGKARYPLPAEGQPLHLPRYLGGKSIEDPEYGRKAPEDTKYWDEGWYFWKTTSFLGVYNSISQMQNNLDKQVRLEAAKQEKRKLWKEYQEFLKSGGGTDRGEQMAGPRSSPEFRARFSSGLFTGASPA